MLNASYTSLNLVAFNTNVPENIHVETKIN